jgi:TfoX/Sxy family transcriptional regulator of competence genes
MSEAADELAHRLRALIGHRPGVTEKKMFGGVGFMHYGNMIVGAMKSGALLVRVGPARHQEAQSRPGAAAMEMGGKQMTGFVEVTDEGIETDEALLDWIAYSEEFVTTLPPK